MSTFAIKLPVRDPDEVISLKGISEIADLAPSEDRETVRECLLFFYEISVKDHKSIRIGQLGDLFEQLTNAERRDALSLWRHRAGLKTVRAQQAQDRFDAANSPAALFARINQETRLAISDSGAVVDAAEMEREGQRAESEARSRAAKQEARRVEAEAEMAPIREHDEARAAELDHLLPAYMRGKPIE